MHHRVVFVFVLTPELSCSKGVRTTPLHTRSFFACLADDSFSLAKMEKCDRYFETQPAPPDLERWGKEVQSFVEFHKKTDRPVVLVTVRFDF